MFDDATQAKKRLEEAKARLKEEKRRLREEMQASKRHSHSRRPHNDFNLQPWMIWDIAIVIVMIILFSTAMYFPRPGVSAENVTTEDSKNINTTESEGISKIIVEETSGDVILPEEEVEEEEVVDKRGSPDFSLTIEDEEGKVLEEVVTTGASYTYNIVIKNLENEYLICNGDRITDDDKDENYYQNLKLHPNEKEVLPNVAIGPGRVEIRYEISCIFHDGTDISKLGSEFDVTFTGVILE